MSHILPHKIEIMPHHSIIIENAHHQLSNLDYGDIVNFLYPEYHTHLLIPLSSTRSHYLHILSQNLLSDYWLYFQNCRNHKKISIKLDLQTLLNPFIKLLCIDTNDSKKTNPHSQDKFKFDNHLVFWNNKLCIIRATQDAIYILPGNQLSVENSITTATTNINIIHDCGDITPFLASYISLKYLRATLLTDTTPLLLSAICNLTVPNKDGDMKSTKATTTTNNISKSSSNGMKKENDSLILDNIVTAIHCPPGASIATTVHHLLDIIQDNLPDPSSTETSTLILTPFITTLEAINNELINNNYNLQILTLDPTITRNITVNKRDVTQIQYKITRLSLLLQFLQENQKSFNNNAINQFLRRHNNVDQTTSTTTPQPSYPYYYWSKALLFALTQIKRVQKVSRMHSYFTRRQASLQTILDDYSKVNNHHHSIYLSTFLDLSQILYHNFNYSSTVATTTTTNTTINNNSSNNNDNNKLPSTINTIIICDAGRVSEWSLSSILILNSKKLYIIGDNKRLQLPLQDMVYSNGQACSPLYSTSFHEDGNNNRNSNNKISSLSFWNLSKLQYTSVFQRIFLGYKQTHLTLPLVRRVSFFHPRLCSFVSSHFYSGLLRTISTVSIERRLVDRYGIWWIVTNISNNNNNINTNNNNNNHSNTEEDVQLCMAVCHIPFFKNKSVLILTYFEYQANSLSEALVSEFKNNDSSNIFIRSVSQIGSCMYDVVILLGGYHFHNVGATSTTTTHATAAISTTAADVNEMISNAGIDSKECMLECLSAAKETFIVIASPNLAHRVPLWRSLYYNSARVESVEELASSVARSPKEYIRPVRSTESTAAMFSETISTSPLNLHPATTARAAATNAGGATHKITPKREKEDIRHFKTGIRTSSSRPVTKHTSNTNSSSHSGSEHRGRSPKSSLSTAVSEDLHSDLPLIRNKTPFQLSPASAANKAISMRAAASLLARLSKSNSRRSLEGGSKLPFSGHPKSFPSAATVTGVSPSSRSNVLHGSPSNTDPQKLAASRRRTSRLPPPPPPPLPPLHHQGIPPPRGSGASPAATPPVVAASTSRIRSPSISKSAATASASNSQKPKGNCPSKITPPSTPPTLPKPTHSHKPDIAATPKQSLSPSHTDTPPPSLSKARLNLSSDLRPTASSPLAGSRTTLNKKTTVHPLSYSPRSQQVSRGNNKNSKLPLFSSSNIIPVIKGTNRFTTASPRSQSKNKSSFPMEIFKTNSFESEMSDISMDPNDFPSLDLTDEINDVGFSEVDQEEYRKILTSNNNSCASSIDKSGSGSGVPTKEGEEEEDGEGDEDVCTGGNQVEYNLTASSFGNSNDPAAAIQSLSRLTSDDETPPQQVEAQVVTDGYILSLEVPLTTHTARVTEWSTLSSAPPPLARLSAPTGNVTLAPTTSVLPLATGTLPVVRPTEKPATTASEGHYTAGHPQSQGSANSPAAPPPSSSDPPTPAAPPAAPAAAAAPSVTVTPSGATSYRFSTLPGAIKARNTKALTLPVMSTSAPPHASIIPPNITLVTHVDQEGATRIPSPKVDKHKLEMRMRSSFFDPHSKSYHEASPNSKNKYAPHSPSKLSDTSPSALSLASGIPRVIVEQQQRELQEAEEKRQQQQQQVSNPEVNHKLYIQDTNGQEGGSGRDINISQPPFSNIETVEVAVVNNATSTDNISPAAVPVPVTSPQEPNAALATNNNSNSSSKEKHDSPLRGNKTHKIKQPIQTDVASPSHGRHKTVTFPSELVPPSFSSSSSKLPTPHCRRISDPMSASSSTALRVALCEFKSIRREDSRSKPVTPTPTTNSSTHSTSSSTTTTTRRSSLLPTNKSEKAIKSTALPPPTNLSPKPNSGRATINGYFDLTLTASSSFSPSPDRRTDAMAAATPSANEASSPSGFTTIHFFDSPQNNGNEMVEDISIKKEPSNTNSNNNSNSNNSSNKNNNNVRAVNIAPAATVCNETAVTTQAATALLSQSLTAMLPENSSPVDLTTSTTALSTVNYLTNNRNSSSSINSSNGSSNAITLLESIQSISEDIFDGDAVSLTNSSKSNNKNMTNSNNQSKNYNNSSVDGSSNSRPQLQDTPNSNTRRNTLNSSNISKLPKPTITSTSAASAAATDTNNTPYVLCSKSNNKSGGFGFNNALRKGGSVSKTAVASASSSAVATYLLSSGREEQDISDAASSCQESDAAWSTPDVASTAATSVSSDPTTTTKTTTVIAPVNLTAAGTAATATTGSVAITSIETPTPTPPRQPPSLLPAAIESPPIVPLGSPTTSSTELSDVKNTESPPTSLQSEALTEDSFAVATSTRHIQEETHTEMSELFPTNQNDSNDSSILTMHENPLTLYNNNSDNNNNNKVSNPSPDILEVPNVGKRPLLKINTISEQNIENASDTDSLILDQEPPLMPSLSESPPPTRRKSSPHSRRLRNLSNMSEFSDASFKLLEIAASVGVRIDYSIANDLIGSVPSGGGSSPLTRTPNPVAVAVSEADTQQTMAPAPAPGPGPSTDANNSNSNNNNNNDSGNDNNDRLSGIKVKTNFNSIERKSYSRNNMPLARQSTGSPAIQLSNTSAPANNAVATSSNIPKFLSRKVSFTGSPFKNNKFIINNNKSKTETAPLDTSSKGDKKPNQKTPSSYTPLLIIPPAPVDVACAVPSSVIVRSPTTGKFRRARKDNSSGGGGASGDMSLLVNSMDPPSAIPSTTAIDTTTTDTTIKEIEIEVDSKSYSENTATVATNEIPFGSTGTTVIVEGMDDKPVVPPRKKGSVGFHASPLVTCNTSGYGNTPTSADVPVVEVSGVPPPARHTVSFGIDTATNKETETETDTLPKTGKKRLELNLNFSTSDDVCTDGSNDCHDPSLLPPASDDDESPLSHNISFSDTSAARSTVSGGATPHYIPLTHRVATQKSKYGVTPKAIKRPPLEPPPSEALAEEYSYPPIGTSSPVNKVVLSHINDSKKSVVRISFESVRSSVDSSGSITGSAGANSSNIHLALSATTTTTTSSKKVVGFADLTPPSTDNSTDLSLATSFTDNKIAKKSFGFATEDITTTNDTSSATTTAFTNSGKSSGRSNNSSKGSSRFFFPDEDDDEDDDEGEEK